MIKTFLVIFAIALCVVTAEPALSANNEDDEIVNLIGLEPVSTEQDNCFSAAIEEAWSNNPDMNQFFQSIEKAHKDFLEKIKTCSQSSDNDLWVAVISFENFSSMQ